MEAAVGRKVEVSVKLFGCRFKTYVNAPGAQPGDAGVLWYKEVVEVRPL